MFVILNWVKDYVKFVDIVFDLILKKILWFLICSCVFYIVESIGMWSNFI